MSYFAVELPLPPVIFFSFGWSKDSCGKYLCCTGELSRRHTHQIPINTVQLPKRTLPLRCVPTKRGNRFDFFFFFQVLDKLRKAPEDRFICATAPRWLVKKVTSVPAFQDMFCLICPPLLAPNASPTLPSRQWAVLSEPDCHSVRAPLGAYQPRSKPVVWAPPEASMGNRSRGTLGHLRSCVLLSVHEKGSRRAPP